MPIAAALACIVHAVSDGDSIRVRGDAQAEQPAQTIIVRLAEVDAPEKGQAWGTRSRQHLADLCYQRQAVVTPRTHDRYGRTVARAECDGTDASAEQVHAGMAWTFTKYLTDPQIKAIEVEARAEHRGLWADAAPAPPWEWRAGKSAVP